MKTLRRSLAMGLVLITAPLMAIVPSTPSNAASVTPAFVQSANSGNGNGFGSATSVTATFSTSTILGDLIVASYAYQDSPYGSTCSDSSGNSYSNVADVDIPGYSQAGGMCYALVTHPGASTVTVTFNGSVPWRLLTIAEYSGIAASSPLDVSASQAGVAVANGTDSVTSTAASTTVAGDLIVGAFEDGDGNSPSVTAGTNFTARDSVCNACNNELTTEDMIDSPTGSIAATETFNNTDHYAAIMAAFKPFSGYPPATQISQGGTTTCAVMRDANAYCWGDNTYGQFGDGTTTSSATPVLVSGGLKWRSISTSNAPGPNNGTTCGVTTSGTGYCWGYNQYGNVGDGTTSQRLTPTLVSGGYTWAELTAGDVYTCGVTVAHVGYCWGWGGNGQLGNGGTANVSSPTAVSGGYSWSEISTSQNTVCGVTTSNVGYCWGKNDHGQIGDNTTTDENAPALISGGDSWSSISVSNSDACGVTTAGAGYCWGWNTFGEAGDGTSSERHVPTAVSGNHAWSSISLGWLITCGTTTTGTGYCWGYNSAGQLGNGAGGNVNTPQLVSGGLTFAVIYPTTYVDGSGNATVCGIAVDGIAYCWGHNDHSQIGDGTTTDRNVPTETSLLFALTSNTDLSVTIRPTFTFTLANKASACNGESNFVSGAGTSSAVALGNLAAGANVSGGQALSVAGNAGGGFVVYVAGPLAASNLHSASHNWMDVSGSYASPAPLSGGAEQFGYTYKDSTASSSVTNPTAANFIALTNTNEAVLGSTSSPTGNGCISFDAQASASTPAASYSATVVYTAVPTF